MAATDSSLQRLPVRQAVVRALGPTIAYLGVAILVLWALPERAWYIKRQALVAITLFGMWRYSWQVIHAVRHLIYKLRVFPRLRAEADAVDDPYPKRLYIMVPSYKEDFNVSERVFQALVRDVRELPSRVMIVASVGSDREADFISRAVAGVRGGDNVHLVFMHQEQGKRIAMGHALRAIARDYNDVLEWHPDARNDVVVFMDGDTLVQPGTCAKCLPFFRTHPKMGALTTDNIGMQEDVSSLFHDWYSLKFAQRNHQFHSHSLSKRVLTITGRFSMYRADVVVKEDFIRFVEADYLEGWLFGRFRFLMGDDKSTWFYLLKQGWEMLYIPDAPVVAMESRQKDFFRTSLSLMKRWYGNMLRNNSRAIKLGPRPMGGFIWWCILDQRFTTWTPLVGPAGVLMLAVFSSPYYLAFYFSWVVITRLTLFWVYVFQGFVLRTTHLPLMLYNQWAGAALKVVTMYNLDKQTWKKKRGGDQRIEGQSYARQWMQQGIRRVLVVLNFTLLLLLCGLASGAISLPSVRHVVANQGMVKVVHIPEGARLVARLRTAPGQDIGGPVMKALSQAEAGQPLTVVLPAGRFFVDTPVVIERDDVIIRGQGREETKLVSRLSTKQGDAVFAIVGSRGPRRTELSARYHPSSTIVPVVLEKPWDEADRMVWVAAPNDTAFFDELDARLWRRQYPWLRQFIGRVEDAGADFLLLRRGPGVALPAGAEVRAPVMRTGIVLQGFTMEQQVPGMTPQDVTGKYENLAPEHAVDGIFFKWARDCLVADVAVIMAGRHPVWMESSTSISVRNTLVDGAWNKGKEGNGYFRLSRSHFCQVEDSVIRNVRHLTIQWSSSHNVVRNCEIGTDVNFHGGYSHHNTVEGCTIEPPPGHKWGRVTRMPPGGAAYAPPDGPDNLVIP